MTSNKRRKEILWGRLEKKLCAICGGGIKKETCNIDHIVPRSKGGNSRIENLQLTHVDCNQQKKDTLPSQIRKEQLKKEAKRIYIHSIT